MKSILLLLSLLYCQIVFSQNHKGIAFQAVARTSNGVVMPNKLIQIRISIVKDTLVETLLYQEIKSVTTSPLGLFTILIGTSEPAKIVTIGAFEKINWTAGTYFIRVEIDPENHLQFIRIGQQQIQYTAYAFSADHVLAENLEGVLSIPQGGTGVNNLSAFKLALQIDKVNNIPDSLKILSKASIQALTFKLDKKDTASLSNRINQKLNKGEITASELAVGLGFLPLEIYFGAFADTARQMALTNTATAVKWRDTIGLNQTAIGLNTSLDPTRLLVVKSGTYLVQYSLQVSNSQVANDEISVWIRRNGAAYPNTLRQFSTGAVGVKNIFSGQTMMVFGEDDYLELFFSVKHNQTQLLKTSSLTNPSRPATPSAQIMLYRIQ
ncbi:MAG: hypothetical protein K9H79_01225 [Chitinophagaceae bacterium]|nr:hypothetical protein [Chitinophagaceae bacterium]MCF8421492.1 hypothetical protein [Chitinophagaceae bacterium]